MRASGPDLTDLISVSLARVSALRITRKTHLRCPIRYAPFGIISSRFNRFSTVFKQAYARVSALRLIRLIHFFKSCLLSAPSRACASGLRIIRLINEIGKNMRPQPHALPWCVVIVLVADFNVFKYSPALEITLTYFLFDCYIINLIWCWYNVYYYPSIIGPG